MHFECVKEYGDICGKGKMVFAWQRPKVYGFPRFIRLRNTRNEVAAFVLT